MKKLNTFLTLVMIIAFASIAVSAENEETAKSWQEQAQSTRAVVVGVADELGKIGDKGNPYAKDLIEDAVKWIEEGDNELANGDKAMEKEEWEKANFAYNMAWQLYVKAATAGLNAKSILTGE